MARFICNPSTGTVERIDNDTFVVEISTTQRLFQVAARDPREFMLSAADDKAAIVIPLNETLDSLAETCGCV